MSLVKFLHAINYEDKFASSLRQSSHLNTQSVNTQPDGSSSYSQFHESAGRFDTRSPQCVRPIFGIVPQLTHLLNAMCTP